MKVILHRLLNATNLPRRRYALRFYSNDVEATDQATIKKNIKIDKYGPITTLNIDRQATRNSLDVPTLQEMTKAINEFDNDKESKVLVINGEGGTFCSGFDAVSMEKNGYFQLKDAALRLERRPLCNKITIAAVSGYAVAEGFELALSCDLRVVEDTAIMGCLGRRFGVPQSLFGAHKLTSLIGLSPALDLLITGRLISGVDAQRIGLACKITTTGTALGESIKLAKSITKFPENALIMDKMAAITSQLNTDSEDSMRHEAIMSSLFGNAIIDIQDGVKKFQSGIGRHGKFHSLKEVQLKDWELEDTAVEVIIKIKDEPEQQNSTEATKEENKTEKPKPQKSTNKKVITE